MKGLVKLSTILVGVTLATASFATNYCGYAVGNMPAGKCHMVMSSAETRIDVPSNKAEEAKYDRKQSYKRAYRHHSAAKASANQ